MFVVQTQSARKRGLGFFVPYEAQERRGDAGLQILLLLTLSTAQKRPGCVGTDFYALFAQDASYGRLPSLDDRFAMQGKKMNERLHEFCIGDYPIGVDVQAREKALVEHASFFRVRRLVVAVAVLRDAERTVEGVNDLRPRLHGTGDDLLVGIEFPRKAIHL
ncbi:hypothetical protein ACH49M_09075 [Rhodococcus qingshengii]|uniref:hypothetical protein n=1 Tax=Rhodococcus qingshengii TaxID=334542 RepID=UPI0036FAAB83